MCVKNGLRPEYFPKKIICVMYSAQIIGSFRLKMDFLGVKMRVFLTKKSTFEDFD